VIIAAFHFALTLPAAALDAIADFIPGERLDIAGP